MKISVVVVENVEDSAVVVERMKKTALVEMNESYFDCSCRSNFSIVVMRSLTKEHCLVDQSSFVLLLLWWM